VQRAKSKIKGKGKGKRKWRKLNNEDPNNHYSSYGDQIKLD
jgi:hypothetical protein